MNESPLKTKPPWRSLGLVALIIVLGFTFRDDVTLALHSLESAIVRAGPWGPVLFTLVFSLWGILCIPGTVMLALAGTAFASQPLLAIACVSVGDTIAQGVAFQVAKHGGRERVSAWLGDKAWFVWLKERITTGGGKAVFTIRLMPFFPNSLGSYAFGLTDLRFWPYLFASWAGTLPNVALCVGGTAGIVHLLKTKQGEYDLLIALGLLSVFAIATFLMRRKLLKRTS